MQCEICGSNAGKGRRATIDGIEMVVCDACVSLGIEKKSPSFAPRQIESPQEKVSFEQEELKKRFGRIISIARQKKGLTFEELGKKIFEPASLLKRIESEHLVPSDKLVAKLEKALEIKLKEKQE